MSVSANTSKDASTKASVLFSNYFWARMLRHECQCHHEQGCFYKGISALQQLLLGKGVITNDTSALCQLFLGKGVLTKDTSALRQLLQGKGDLTKDTSAPSQLIC